MTLTIDLPPELELRLREEATKEGLDVGYRRLAIDEAQEAEALEWAEATIGDVRNDSR